MIPLAPSVRRIDLASYPTGPGIAGLGIGYFTTASGLAKYLPSPYFGYRVDWCRGKNSEQFSISKVGFIPHHHQQRPKLSTKPWPSFLKVAIRRIAVR